MRHRLWRESGGPPRQAAVAHGLRRVVVPSQRAVRSRRRKRDRLSRAGGLRRVSLIPAAHILKIVAQQASAPVWPRGRAPAAARSRASGVLLVEDQLVIALDAEDILRRAGAANVETASSVRDALKLLPSFAPDLAILDVNLRRRHLSGGRGGTAKARDPVRLRNRLRRFRIHSQGHETRARSSQALFRRGADQGARRGARAPAARAIAPRRRTVIASGVRPAGSLI